MAFSQLGRLAVAAILAVSGGLCLAAPATFDDRYSDFGKKIRDFSGQPRSSVKNITTAAYAEFMRGQPSLAELTAGPAIGMEELKLRARAADEAAFYSGNSAYALEFRDLTRLLERQGNASPSTISRVYFALLSVRDFAAAESWRLSHPEAGFGALPEITLLPPELRSKPSVLVLHENKRALEQRLVDMKTGPVVVAVGYPQCHFSKNSVTDIENDPVLQKRLQNHIRWITPQDRNFDFERLQKWNAEHPTARLAITYLADAWFDIDTWATPTFYFFKDGKLMNKVEGWPKEGSKPQLDKALQSIGL